MRLIEELEGHLIFEVEDNIVCVPVENPRAAFPADSLKHARALILQEAEVSYESAMLA